MKYLLSMFVALILGTVLYFAFLHRWSDESIVSHGNSGEKNVQSPSFERADSPVPDDHTSSVRNLGAGIPKRSPLFPQKRESVARQESPTGNPEEITILPESVLRETRDQASDVSKITIEADGMNLTPERRRKIEGLIAERDKMLDELRKANLSEAEKIEKTKEVNDRINGKIQSELRGKE